MDRLSLNGWEKPWRNRDDEFVDTFKTRDELIAAWDTAGNGSSIPCLPCPPTTLAKTVTIRGEPHSVPLAIQRSLAHCAYHVGQIMLTARILANDQWTTITIPRGASATSISSLGKGHYQSPLLSRSDYTGNFTAAGNSVRMLTLAVDKLRRIGFRAN